MTTNTPTPTTDAPAIRMRDNWVMAAEDVLSVLMAEPEAYYRAAFDNGLLAEHFPPGELRDLYQAIGAIRLKNTDAQGNAIPVNDTTLVFECKQRVPEYTVNEIRRLYDPERAAGFSAAVTILKAHGNADYTVRRLEQAQRALIAGESMDQVIGALMGALEMEIGQDIDDCTATGALAAARDQWAQGPARVFATGLPIIDDLVGGVMRRWVMWIAGRYKGGKSSGMRTAVLGVLRDGASVSILSLEGYQEMIVNQFVAMLMAEYMLKNGLYNQARTVNEETIWLRDIGPLAIALAGNAYESLWLPEQIAARKWAEAEFAKFGHRLRLYDPRQAKGRVSDLASVNRLIAKDVKQYGADLVCLDYLGRLKRSPGQSYFDLTDDAALALQDTALSKEIAILVLAQLNEEAVKSNTSGKGEGSPGIKGGGTPAATADALWVVGGDDGEYNPADPLFRMELRLARYAPSSKKGAKQEAYYHLHAPSGYVIPPHYAEMYWKSIDLGLY